MPIEVDILGHSCDVVRHGILLKSVSIRLALSVLISRDSATSLQILLVKLLRYHESPLDADRKRHCFQPDAQLDNVFGVTRNLCYFPVLSRMKRTDPWKLKMNLGEDHVSISEPFSRHARKAPRHHQHEDMFRHGIHHGAHRCAGGLGSKFLFNGYRAFLEGSAIPDGFAEWRTVFNTQDFWHWWQWKDHSISRRSSPVDIVQLRLQVSYFCHLSRPLLVHHEMHSSVTEMHLILTNDGQHLLNWDPCSGPCRVCSARIRCSSDWLCCCCSQCQPFLDLLCAWEHWVARFFCRFLRSTYRDSITHVECAGAERRQLILCGQRSTTRLSCERFLFCNGFWPDLQMAPRVN